MSVVSAKQKKAVLGFMFKHFADRLAVVRVYHWFYFKHTRRTVGAFNSKSSQVAGQSLDITRLREIQAGKAFDFNMSMCLTCPCVSISI